ncbi:general secretion pathway protein C [Yersinia frederiksenii]|uniref:General secretion pathway protein C n=3 Tax=Yersinia frederiksenii TaxID=29484 RepID=A0A380PTA9_YERFR|nr:type II secretion system protein N [Yersinia frederiksenii]KGA48655.1 type IV pilus biogenesis family protein [Yersinia frederiksenii ATCC 33641]SUP76836.1 general secretion pathway protein C [Yersinia frederiksenii]
MLSFFTRIVITPYEMLVKNKIYILDIVIITCVIYQFYIGLIAIIYEEERPIPLLYESEYTEDDNLTQRVKWLEEIKQIDFFRASVSDATIDEDNKVITDMASAPSYTGNLKLAGILKHTDESKSIAILSINGEQNIYFTHDIIEDINIVIVMILVDRIIISEKNLYYTLVIQ